jgi:hypothetical protein
MDTWRDNFIGDAIMAGLLAIPVLGCTLAVVQNNGWWLLLLLPLFAFMEAGLFFGAVALFTVSAIMGW